MVLLVERENGRRGDACRVRRQRLIYNILPESKDARGKRLTSVNLDLDLALARRQDKRLISILC